MHFDRVARHYDWMEAVTAGPLLERARAAWIPDLAGCQRLLSAGEGHGRFAAAALRAHPELRIHAVDESPKMFSRARRRICRTPGSLERITFEVASLPGWTPPAEPFDAIATCFFLDCFPPDEQAAVIQNLAAAATPDALWVMVDFVIPDRGFLRWRAQFAHWVMYTFFGIVTGLHARHWHPPAASLQAAGFHKLGRKTFNHGLIASELWRRG